MIPRRTMLIGGLLAGSNVSLARANADNWNDRLREGVAALEQRHGGSLGCAVLDTARSRRFEHRGHERFPLCSTFKFLAAAFVLARVDRGQEKLSRRVIYAASDLVPYSPVTEKHAGADGLTIGEICDAAMALSDNTAGNLMLGSFGGPAALTAYARSLGDPVTRLDHLEPELNEARPGDRRDTTTPVAMLNLLRQTVLGSALSARSREQLTTWLVGNKVGNARLRAGVPNDWRIGDRTGSGARNATNDIAVIWPPGRKPMIVTAYYIDARALDVERNKVLADLGRLISG